MNCSLIEQNEYMSHEHVIDVYHEIVTVASQ